MIKKILFLTICCIYSLASADITIVPSGSVQVMGQTSNKLEDGISVETNLTLNIYMTDKISAHVSFTENYQSGKSASTLKQAHIRYGGTTRKMEKPTILMNPYSPSKAKEDQEIVMESLAANPLSLDMKAPIQIQNANIKLEDKSPDMKKEPVKTAQASSSISVAK